MIITDTDCLVVGSGIAGLMSALHLARDNKVMLVTKKNRADSNTNYAQGGIACVVASNDSFEQHVADTMDAGAGLCDEDVVRRVVRDGPDRIRELEDLGLTFTERTDPGDAGYDLGREGGHSRRRVLHVGDITGREVEAILLSAAMSEPNITLLEHHMVIDLVCSDRVDLPGPNRCIGAYVLDENEGRIEAIRTPYTVLATGGGGKVYLYTSNPDIATGDGIAMAWRAGVPTRNMEFIQFHPTCFYHPAAKSFLISEAVRGEGAHLVDAEGRRFMPEYDKRADLSPRDIVSRAIDSEMKRTGAECVYLDIRHKPAAFIEERFPNISEVCMSFGVDMTRDLVPVVPAAHYFCGGIEARIDGTTALPGLYACGETACTGIHGANRLASNSLLEALVSAHAAAETIRAEDHPGDTAGLKFPPWHEGDAVPSDEEVVIEHDWNEVRSCMWDYVGIVRTDLRLERALSRIQILQGEIKDYYWKYVITPDLLELRNITDVAELIVRSAMLRKESRGLHYTLDYPELDTAAPASDTVLLNEF